MDHDQEVLESGGTEVVMPDRTLADQTEKKLDNSGHPLHEATPADLRDPGGGVHPQSDETRNGVAQPEPVVPGGPGGQSPAR